MSTRLIRETKKILVEEGWRQGGGDYSRGPRCILHALAKAAFRIGDASRKEVRNAIRVLGRLTGGDPKIEPTNWNDTPGRTVDEVLALCDQAIAEDRP